MENPNHKWRFSSLGKSSISMGHGFHGYASHNQRVAPKWPRNVGYSSTKNGALGRKKKSFSSKNWWVLLGPDKHPSNFLMAPTLGPPTWILWDPVFQAPYCLKSHHWTHWRATSDSEFRRNVGCIKAWDKNMWIRKNNVLQTFLSGVIQIPVYANHQACSHLVKCSA